MDFMSISYCSMILVSLFSFQSLLILQAANDNVETYIVHVQSPNDVQLATDIDHDQKMDLESWYHSFLLTESDDNNNIAEEFKSESKSRLIHSYKHIFNGFVARLTRKEVKSMEKKKGFISAQVQEILSIDTTHSPDYLGLIQNSGLWKDSNYGKGVIIGVLDTGIAPNHPSFRGNGIPSPPTKWKGRCQFSPIANPRLCNNKLIGVRYLSTIYGSGLDEDGHGTHTASIAAGNYVQGANIYGNANGTARGVAPLAHLAIYKVCDNRGYCSESSILAGLDLAIEDGVDILSISISDVSKPFHMDNIAIGAFSAMERGIFVSTSAGNNGPYKSSLRKGAPWMLVVGATNTDRKTIAIAKLGNNVELEGQSVYQPNDFPSTMLPLIFIESLNFNDDDNPYGWINSFSYIDTIGKIVVCIEGGRLSQIQKGKQVKKVGGAGMILINKESSGYTINDDVHVLPTVQLNYADGVRLVNYIKSSNSPTATIIYKGTSINPSQNSPIVASFSSRGPSIQSPGILKPDILGPGLNIIAAWPFSVEKNTQRGKSTFNMISGTSMSCPHLSGVAALLKSAHPDWSPSAIMSAIITTTDIINHQNNPIEDEKHQPASIFATGAGHVNPSKANNPGFVYVIHRLTDYFSYLCGLKYTNFQVSKIVRRNVICSKKTSIIEAQLNYPSISVFLGSHGLGVVKVMRTATNVGNVVESYTVRVIKPLGVHVTINPTTLSFKKIKENLTYEVTFARLPTATGEFAQGSLSWVSTKHIVRSPIVAIFN